MTAPLADATATIAGSRKHYGKYPGFVVDRGPAAGGSHHRGELRVRVPGLLEEDGSGGQRPLEALAAPAFPPGLFWVPEVGDPVWVEFAAGELEHPIWTGVWYPDDGTPATVDGDRPTAEQKVIRTPSGQVVQLEDTDGAQRLVLVDEANQSRIVLDGQGITLESGACSIALAGSTITITNGAHTFELATGATTLDYAGMGAQALVLAPLLDWLQTHNHTGNMGAPTPPFPADLALLLAPAPPKKSGP